MDLPDDSIGISDIIGWQECARKMTFQSKRWTEEGEPPEAAENPTALYGSAFHDGVEFIEANGASDEEAIQHLMANGHRWLDPAAIKHLRTDFETYRTREPVGVRTVLNEGELRMPLLVHKGRQIYFRGRIDRLYQSTSDPGLWFHRDYKSSAWPKLPSEVHEDKQMWAYNALIHWHFPEIEHLQQTYDQLQFGELDTSKTEEQREEIVEWLRFAVVAILEDDEVGPDGLGVPTWNQWCKWCPIMESCPVIPMLTEYAVAEIASIAPTTKDGRKIETHLDPDLFALYVDEMKKADMAAGVLERFVKTVKSQLLSLPPQEREAFGFDVRTKMIDSFPPAAMRAMHNLLGDDFYDIVSVTKTAIEGKVSDETKRDLIVGMADKRRGAPYVQKKAPKRARGTKRGPR